LHREILEETGWSISKASPLGFIHFQHLASKPNHYAYPHPRFVQLIYVAHAAEFVPQAQQSGEYELETSFQSIVKAQTLNMTDSQQLFLHSALEACGR
jgi:8-oxo-dGTP pyrophosphatase MutT (NUDIX family)